MRRIQENGQCTAAAPPAPTASVAPAPRTGATRGEGASLILRSLLVAALLLLGYHFLQPQLPRGYFRVPGQQRANLLTAQRYVHDQPEDVSVVLGSSMANELSEAILGPEYYKLTFPGGCLLTGLEILRHTGRRPRVLLIESNLILRDPDPELLNDTVRGWRRFVRRYFPELKEEGRPSDFAIGFVNLQLRKVVRQGERWLGKTPPAEITAPTGRRIDLSVLTKVMSMNSRVLGTSPPEAELARRTRELGELVDQLTLQGSTCVFFEMPIDPALQHLAEPEAVRAAMRARFPSDRYHWINFPEERPYQTVDGIHLTRDDAERVTRTLREGVSSLLTAKR